MKRLLLPCACALLAVCGGNGGTTPTPPAANSNRFTVTSGGVTPKELTVAPGTRVTFANSDSRRHDIGSDPHPEHTDCPEINSVGVLNAGQSRETENLNTAGACGFHDHDRPNDSSLKGRIVVR